MEHLVGNIEENIWYPKEDVNRGLVIYKYDNSIIELKDIIINTLSPSLNNELKIIDGHLIENIKFDIKDEPFVVNYDNYIFSNKIKITLNGTNISVPGTSFRDYCWLKGAKNKFWVKGFYERNYEIKNIFINNGEVNALEGFGISVKLNLIEDGNSK